MISRYTHLILALVCCSCAATALLSCSDEELDSQSVFEDRASTKKSFDNWLFENYVMPYNIELKYHLEDKETDFQYSLVPATTENSIKVAHAVLYCWLQAYDEVAGATFTRKYVPKVIQLVGSNAHNKKGTVVMGTAENGMKVTLYAVNFFTNDRSTLNSYFQIMHHEFTHILTQNIDYDTEFRTISDGDYITGDWSNKFESESLAAGFITPYAMSEYNEDFAETLSYYLIYTSAQWTAKMRLAGDEGTAIIGRKIELIRKYMQTAWNIDIDELRDVLQRRINDVVAGKIDLQKVES
ncbi:MAG: putative zinc-binding metallopeptidase [Bacteroidaceae bacterium]|nr:putative zinc-binding metallopeptidase [Bacteroidaceae bacterium]